MNLPDWRKVRDHYTIDEDHVVHGPFSFDEWMPWALEVEDYEEFKRLCRVGLTYIDGDCHVSTVFLRGLDHNLRRNPYGPHPADYVPVLFETLVVGGEHDQEMWRYSTWAEAEAGHQHAVDLVMQPAEASDTRPDPSSGSS